MELQFASNKLERILTDPRLLLKYHGNDSGKIASRLSELIAVNNLVRFQRPLPPRRHKLTGNYQGSWGISYSKNDRITIEPVG